MAPSGSGSPSVTRERRFRDAALDELPDGAFVLRDGEPWLVCGERLLSWTAAGYRARTSRPAGERALLITPPSLLPLLRDGREGLVPLLHPSARG